MTPRACLALLTLPLLAACGGGEMRLYPVSGPIADLNPAHVVVVKADNDNETSGPISFRLPKPSKLKCKGTWTSVTPKIVSREKGVSLTLRDTGGKLKRSTEDVGGINTGEIYAVCSDGTRVQGWFRSGSGTQSGTGTATDTLGNSYKLLF